jgi:ribosome-binding protein aMBF1 (putative translation factor)
LAADLASRGWKVHHLARMLDERPSVVWAWFYGRAEMPHHLRRQAERLLGLAPGSLT